jgi:putative CocE/NonD family hydrolase
MKSSLCLAAGVLNIAGMILIATPCAKSLSAQQPAAAPAQIAAAFIRENYTKFEYRIPARDGVRLFVSVFVPKDVFTDGRKYPVMMSRTPYSVAPYGVDVYRNNLGPSELFSKEKFIFVYADVRGRYMSEGTPTQLQPHNANKRDLKDTDESTDTYDTIEWLIHNMPGCEPRFGMWGISQPGFYASASMIDAHPALLAVSPQAPVTDYYLGDDDYHNGAFMLAANFGFYQNFRPRTGDPGPPSPTLPPAFGTADGYQFFLNMGSLSDGDEKYFKHSNPFWTEVISNTTYNNFWQSRSIWKHLNHIRPAVMTVGGWFDAEDLQGPLRTHAAIETNHSPTTNMLVMGPWTHGGFSRGNVDRVGNVVFQSNTSAYYREKIEFPFFLSILKGKGDGAFPKAWVFETGRNQWRKFDNWPPRNANLLNLFPAEKGVLAMDRPAQEHIDEYVSDPARPVPYVNSLAFGMRGDYMTEDQRFAATRTDVLVYKTEVLDHDVSVFGPIEVDLKVSTSSTDSDFVVKLIDVYPDDFPNPDPAGMPMGGYQQLVRGEPFRGKYRKSFESPVAFEPGKPDRITFSLPDVAHTFRPGHRIMVQIQSSWFPLTDRNPQKFLDIPHARPADFVKATERLYTGGAQASRISLPVLQ